MTKRARIKSGHIAHNLAMIRQRCPGSAVLAYVKANAYGHGIEQVVPAMNADMLAVADIEEARRVRAVGFKGPVLVQSGYYGQDDWRSLINNDLTPLIHTRDLFIHWLKIKPKNQKIWLKYDTGMYRLGMYDDDLIKCLNESSDIVVMTHMAYEGKDEHNLLAIKRIHDIKQNYQVPICFAPTTLLSTDYDLNAPDWVAPGLALYGMGMAQLKLVMQLEAQVIAVKKIKANARVGYGGLYKSDSDEYIAVLAIGYADGLPQSMGAYHFFTEKEDPCDVVGQVSMDMITVKCPGYVKIGDWMTIWSKAEDVMNLERTSSRSAYTLFTQLGTRVKRESCV